MPARRAAFGESIFAKMNGTFFLQFHLGKNTQIPTVSAFARV